MAQQTDYVDFKKVKSVLFFNQVNDSVVFNSYEVKFDVLKNTDAVYLDAIDMEFLNITLNGSPVNYKNEGTKLFIYNTFKAQRHYTLNLSFFVSPKKAMYFIGNNDKSYSISNYFNANENSIGRKQIWTQGQGKNTSHWLPSIDDMNDKIEFDLSFEVPKDYQVISNGKLVSKKEHSNSILWQFNMCKPMSSYLVALVIGKYNKKVAYSESGIPLEMYYYPEDEAKFEPTYRYTKRIFDFLEEEIEVAYPWQNYKQVPVKDFLYAGMENTSATIFSDSFVIDSTAFTDRNYVNVNAHELAHQWFGDLVTETSGKHHWLQEGFATYYALLAERDIFGNTYYYSKLFEYAQELLEQDKAGASTALINPKSSSTTFYKKGAWVLYLLKEKVRDFAFKKGVKNYLKKYRFKNVKTDYFIREMERASGKDLSVFVKSWIESPKLYYKEMERHLFVNFEAYKDFVQLDCELKPESCFSYLKSVKNPYLKAKVIKSLKGNVSKDIFKARHLKVRQAIAQSISKISPELKAGYESLLQDKSYITIELALFNLWKNFPKERNKYFEQTKDLHGFRDKNIRILWLVLHLISPDLENKDMYSYYQELVSYTGSKYSSETRQTASQYLNKIKASYNTR